MSINEKKIYIDDNKIIQFVNKSRKDFSYFVELNYLYKEYYFCWFHREICNKVQLLLNGISKKKLMILMPQCYGKSTLISQSLPSFILGSMPKLNVTCVLYSLNLAKKTNLKVKDITESKMYKNIFPNVIINNRFKSCSLKEECYRSDNFVIIDDPYYTVLDSDRRIETVWELYNSYWKNKINILIQTRFNSNDIAGRILNSNESKDWDILTFQGIREERKMVDNDPRQIGEALWENFQSAEFISNYKNNKSYNAIYQQQP